MKPLSPKQARRKKEIPPVARNLEQTRDCRARSLLRRYKQMRRKGEAKVTVVRVADRAELSYIVIDRNVYINK